MLREDEVWEQLFAHIPQPPLGPLSVLHAERTELPLQPLPGLDPSLVLTFLGWSQNQLQEEPNLVEDLGTQMYHLVLLLFWSFSAPCWILWWNDPGSAGYIFLPMKMAWIAEIFYAGPFIILFSYLHRGGRILLLSPWGVRLPGFESCFCPLQAVWSWAIRLTSVPHFLFL